MQPKKTFVSQFFVPPSKKQPILAPPPKKSGNNKPFVAFASVFPNGFAKLPCPSELFPDPLSASCQAMERQKRFENLHQSEAEETASEVSGKFRMEPTRRGPLTTISGFIPSYTHLQPWLNRVCWGYNYLITRGAPSCRWWFQMFLFSPRNFGEDFQFWRSYFLDGLVQPPSRNLCAVFFEGFFVPIATCVPTRNGTHFGGKSKLMRIYR